MKLYGFKALIYDPNEGVDQSMEVIQDDCFDDLKRRVGIRILNGKLHRKPVKAAIYEYIEDME